MEGTKKKIKILNNILLNDITNSYLTMLKLKIFSALIIMVFALTMLSSVTAPNDHHNKETCEYTGVEYFIPAGESPKGNTWEDQTFYELSCVYKNRPAHTHVTEIPPL